MMRIPFVKLSGSGNDFVLIEQRRARGRRQSELARRLCDRRGGVGADGLLLLGPKRLDYYNSDGSRAFCANGARCAAWYLHLKNGVRRMRFRTTAGAVEASVAGRGRVRLKMPPVLGVRLGVRLKAAGWTWKINVLDTGAPHAVVEVKGLEKFPVYEVGKALRRHAYFGRGGANVDFVEGRALRTYERGVEEETPACGTGAVAAAVCAHLVHRMRPPVRLRTASGDTLTVGFAPSGSGVRDVWLEGPARVIFAGEAYL